MNKDNKEFKDTELEAVTGGTAPGLPETCLASKVPGIELVIIKPEYEKKSEKDTLVPIPY